MKQIPIENIFHMLSYSWGSLDRSGPSAYSVDAATFPIEIIARELCRACQPIIKRRTALAFQDIEVSTDRPRGKIEFSKSIRSANFALRRLTCNSAIITPNTAPNVVLKAALSVVRRNKLLPIEVRDDAYSLESRLSSVNDIPLSNSIFRQLKIVDVPRAYRFPLALAELLYTQVSPADKTGASWFESFVRDEAKMRKLFEAFLRGLLQSKLRNARVGARRYSLVGVHAGLGGFSKIPKLNADIVVEHESLRTLIIDAKFAISATSNYMGKEILRSDHFYQIFTYVSNYQKINQNRTVSGVVVYPKVENHLDLSFTYQGAIFRFVTVDLMQHWTLIEEAIIGMAAQ